LLPTFEYSALFFLAYLVWVLVVGSGLVLQRRSPVATLGWLFALLALPYIGIVVWVLFGPRRVARRRLHYAIIRSRVDRASIDFRKGAFATDIGEEMRSRFRQLITLATRLRQPPPARADQVDLYFDGDACYAAMEAAIAEAYHHIHIEVYIWEPGRTADHFLERLCEQARRRVAVRVLVDDVGSGRANERYFAPLIAAGGEVAWFNPVRFSQFRPTIANFRTHRKIVVCDGRVGFTGGMNFSSVHSTLSAGDVTWRDTHAMLSGAPVAALQRIFLEDWYFAGRQCSIGSEFFPKAQPPIEGPIVQIIASGPDTADYAIQRFIFSAITTARETIRLTTAYFVPDDATLEALKAAALRGVDVQLLVPHRGDSKLVTAAARSYFDEITRTGIKVFEYGPAMLHAKSLAVDNALAIVGTANIDTRSFRLNFEVVAAIFDRGTAERLSTRFDLDLESAKRYKPMYDRGKLMPRLTAASARLFSPLL
jgi:cardiolipin synthase A/B